ncbi:9336_t:CDS:2, partial [Gigaspora rosea]
WIICRKICQGQGMNDLLYEVRPDIELVQTKAFLNELQYQDGINNVVKIFSKMVDVIQFKPNDLLLSGVLDIQYMEANYKELRNAYQCEGIWNQLVENIQIKDLPNHLK